MTTADLLREAAELKSCPFCGGGELIPFGSEAHPDLWAVLCCKCEAEGPEAANAELAITAWNTRAAADRAPEGRNVEEPRHQGFTTHEAVQVALDNDLEGWEWLRAWWNADLADNDPQSAKYRADLDRFALKSSAKETGT